MQTIDEDPAAAARQLLAGTFRGVLSTHSLEHPGYPFGSLVPYALDWAGLPVLLLSHLSQHTRNLQADRRCGLTVVEPGRGDAQQLSRLSAVGDIEPADPDEVAARHLRYYPQARMYFEQLGFRFFRFRPSRFHWNGGFATARWFGSDRVLRTNPFASDQEDAILYHMNRDHAAAVRHYLGKVLSGPLDPEPVIMVGMDAEGVDLRQADRLYRIPLPHRVDNPSEARAVLVAMARD